MSDKDLGLFCAWLRENGCRYPKIAWPSCATIGGMRGAVAVEDIETNEAMFEIPVKLMMCEINALEDPDIGSYLRQNEDIIQGDVILALYVMNEMRKGTDSFYFPFLRILPTPASVSKWTEDQWEQLQDKAMTVKSKARNNFVKSLYARTVGLLCSRHPDVFPPSEFTFELFWFCYHTVLARAFGRRLPWSALVPFADCLNHNNVQTKYDYDVGGNGLFRMFPTGSNRYPAGAEVFNSYGRRRNDNLLLDYGFALLDNMWEEVDVPLVAPTELPFFPQKLQLLYAAGFQKDFACYIEMQHLPTEALHFLRIVSFSEAELESAQAELKDGNPFRRRREIFGNVFNLRSEGEAVGLLKDILIDMTQRWPTRMDEDEALLEQARQVDDSGEAKRPSSTGDIDDHDNLICALIYRITRKKIVLFTLKKLQIIENFITAVTSNLHNASDLAASLVQDIWTASICSHTYESLGSPGLVVGADGVAAPVLKSRTPQEVSKRAAHLDYLSTLLTAGLAQIHKTEIIDQDAALA